MGFLLFTIRNKIKWYPLKETCWFWIEMSSKREIEAEGWKGVPGIGERKLKMCIRQPSSRLLIGQNEASVLFFLFHFLLFASSSPPPPSIFASISMPLSLSLSLSLSLRHGPFFLCGFLERFFLRFLTLTRSNRQQTLLLGFLSNKFFFF